MEQWLNSRWYKRPGLLWLLWPLEALFRLVAAWRRRLITPRDCGAPVVVVGNISVGGSGKTPVVLAVAKALDEAGFRPGIVSRGYGGQAQHYPLLVDPHTPAEQAGDEPCLLARRSGLPLAVAPDRLAAAKMLVQEQGCNVIISDDGLQHYRLARQLEILVIDSQRGFGNGHCLPLGPLREPVARAGQVDFRIYNGAAEKAADGYSMSLAATELVNVKTAERCPLPAWLEQNKQVNAIAGIGNPQRFFASLETLGFTVNARPLPDHHQPSAADLDFGNCLPLIMTEKDAVKCRAIASDHCWMLPVDAELDPHFYQQLIERLGQ